MNEEKYYKVETIMEKFDLSKNTVYGLVNSPDFPVIRIGRSIRIPKSQLEKYIKGSMEDEYLTPKQIQEVLGMCRDSVYELLKLNELKNKTFNIGKKIYISRTNLDKFMLRYVNLPNVY